MNISISGRHVDVTKALQDYAHEKATKLAKYYDRITNIRVIIDIESSRHIVEMEISVGRGVRLVAKVAHEDMYAAVDLVIDKLERQLTKYKEKLQDHRGRHREGTLPAEGVKDESPKGGDDETYEDVVDRLDKP